MMKLIFIALIATIGLSVPSSAEDYLLAANTKSKKSSSKKSKSSAKKSTVISDSDSRSADGELKQALNLAKQGNYEEASVRLFQLSLSPKYSDKRMQIRYLMGLMLYEMKLYQISAFQFISVIRDGQSKYVSQSLEKLSLAADKLGDDTLLNYAISRVRAESFPAVHRDMLFYRIGEFQIRNGQYGEAVRSLEQVPTDSPFYDKAMYMKGYAYAEAGDAEKAADVFNIMYEGKLAAPVADDTRVAALMGKARALYQKKDWDGAIEAYRSVPRDSEFWHDTLFESSWAMLRSGKFRSAMSNFQSLHSPYYEDSYIPESMLLRAIVYLYICQYDEMDKTLSLFTKLYRPVYDSVNRYLKEVKNPKQYFNDVVYTLQAAERPGFDPSSTKFAVPYLVTRKSIKEGDFQRSFQYIKRLVEEKKNISRLPATWKASGIGKYAIQTLDRRLQKARAKAGRQVRAHMIAVKGELLDLFEQEGFIRYEMINGKKEQLKKKVAGKDLPKTEVNEDTSRDFYIQNGYQYWDFRGEYWLDELGNYHYVGTQSCQ